MTEKAEVLLIGCGNMGQALLGGWLDEGLAPEAIRVVEPGARSRAAAKALGVAAEPSFDVESAGHVDVVVLAVKPQQLDSVLPRYRPLLAASPVFLSIVAGKRLARLEALLGVSAAIVRAMPNTPAAIRRGTTVLCAGTAVTPAQRSMCQTLMRAVGEVAWVEDEALMDAVTALCGSGPAYVFLLIECLAAAGVEQGLSPAIARRLATSTVAGAGEYAATAAEDPSTLRERVTSPGGTTAAALEVLMAKPGLAELLASAVRAAAERSRGLD